MLTQEEVYGRVSATFVAALNVDEDEIRPAVTLQGDLGPSRSTFWTSSSAWSARLASRSRAAGCSPSQPSGATRSSCGMAR